MTRNIEETLGRAFQPIYFLLPRLYRQGRFNLVGKPDNRGLPVQSRGRAVFVEVDYLVPRKRYLLALGIIEVAHRHQLRAGFPVVGAVHELAGDGVEHLVITEAAVLVHVEAHVLGVLHPQFLHDLAGDGATLVRDVIEDDADPRIIENLHLSYHRLHQFHAGYVGAAVGGVGQQARQSLAVLLVTSPAVYVFPAFSYRLRGYAADNRPQVRVAVGQVLKVELVNRRHYGFLIAAVRRHARIHGRARFLKQIGVQRLLP